MTSYPLTEEIGPYPGNGYPTNPNDGNAPLSAWGRLSKNGQAGKKGVLFYNADNPDQQQMKVDLVGLAGQDCDAQPIILTLGPPTVVPIDLATVQASQNITGEVNNFGMRQYQARGIPFPGTAGPIVWPLLEAEIEWGVGGVNFTAIVDFVNGLTINLTASFLRVTARVASTQRSGVTGTTAAYVLAANAGPGFTTARVAQKTVYVGTVGPTGDGVEATLAIGEAIGIGDMVLEWNEPGDAGNDGTVQVTSSAGSEITVTESPGDVIVINIAGPNTTSADAQNAIAAQATLFHVKTGDSDPTNDWADASGSEDFAGGADGTIGESSVFSVPRFTKQARLVGCNNGANPPLTVGTIRFWQSPDGVAGGGNVGNFFFSGNNNEACEVPNGAMYFSVVNGEGIETEFAVVFDLAI